MKTNRRRKNPIKEGFNYSYLTAVKLMRHGCSPNYTGCKGARQAIAGRKAKDHREACHKADAALLREVACLATK